MKYSISFDHHKYSGKQLFLNRIILYAIFLVYGLISFKNAPGDDLSSSYIGCYLLASGNAHHLYDFHPNYFHIVNTDIWVQTAKQAQFQGFLHPYVQIPLWAWILQPICTQMNFEAFKLIFLFTALLSTVLMIELIARNWAKRFLMPISLGLLLIAITVMTPFTYAMWLVQTHIIFILFSVIALYLAERNRPIVAGLLLAIACSVKITPSFLLIFWLVAGRYRASVWFILWSCVLGILTLIAVGWDSVIDYFYSMKRVANILLVSFNNQSLSSWLADSSVMYAELKKWTIFSLPSGFKMISLGASVTSVLMAGWMFKKSGNLKIPMVFALISMTIFSPIAWTHYFLILIPAMMILIDIGGLFAFTIVLIVFLLNSQPIAVDPISPFFTSINIIRSHFISAVIVLFALAILYLYRQKNSQFQ